MAIHIFNNKFNNIDTIYQGPDTPDIRISDNEMSGVGRVVHIVNETRGGGENVNLPNGATHEELLALIFASKKAISDGRDPVDSIARTPIWEKWAALGADLVTIATPIVQFAATLLPK